MLVGVRVRRGDRKGRTREKERKGFRKEGIGGDIREEVERSEKKGHRKEGGSRRRSPEKGRGDEEISRKEMGNQSEGRKGNEMGRSKRKEFGGWRNRMIGSRSRAVHKYNKTVVE